MDSQLVLPTGVEEYSRVPINEDKDWVTDFVPWLEALEEKGVGVEDGFFVATFSNSIKLITEENESDFVKTCGSGVQNIAIQKFQQFHKAKTFHYGVNTLHDKGMIKKFKDEATDIHQYKKETCCTKILEERGITELIAHLDSYMHSTKTLKRCAQKRGWSSSSRVVIEEVGEQLKKNYSKFKGNAANFKWASNKTEAPKNCPEPECGLNSDSVESSSGSDDDDDDDCTQSKHVVQDNVTLYGFGTSDNFKGDLKVTEKFSMTKLFNLLWLLPHKHSGFHSSYYFYGTCHSVFPIHVEDGMTLSLNYVYAGDPGKLWVMIPPWATGLLEYHMKNCGSFLTYMHCSNFLGHKTLVPTFQSLIELNIPFKIVVQKPGDMVVLYPSTAHFGFNLGRNFAEAINVAIPSWVPWGAMARKCSCLTKQIHIPMRPFLMAFRPDLLEDLDHGRAITTPQFVRGMQLLASEVERIGKRHFKSVPQAPALSACRTYRGDTVKHEEGQPSTSGCQVTAYKDMKECPLPKCVVQCKSKKEMLKHVRATHRPLLENVVFMAKIEDIFQEA